MFRGRIATMLSPLTAKLAPYLPQTSPQKNNYYGHLMMLAGAVAFALPIEFLGLGSIKRLAYLLSMWSTIFTGGMNIKANYGAPPMPQMTGFSMAAIQQMMPAMQPWLQPVILSAEFHFLFFALIFVVANPSLFAVLILARRSFWSVCTYCEKNEDAQGVVWRLCKSLWEKCKASNAEVLQQSALAEIMLGVWLAVSLFLPSRQILTCLLYWNYLKIRFQAPKSAAYHVKAWGGVGNTVQPVLKIVPFLSKPIDMGKAWFKPQYQVG